MWIVGEKKEVPSLSGHQASAPSSLDFGGFHSLAECLDDLVLIGIHAMSGNEAKASA